MPDLFDQRLALYESIGLSPQGARIAAIGRHCTTEAEARALVADRPGAPVGGGTAAEAENRVYTAARDVLCLPVEQASVYAHQRHQEALRQHGAEGARVYLDRLAETIRRSPR